MQTRPALEGSHICHGFSKPPRDPHSRVRISVTGFPNPQAFYKWAWILRLATERLFSNQNKAINLEGRTFNLINFITRNISRRVT